MSFTQPNNPVFKASPAKKFLSGLLTNVVVNQDGMIIATYCLNWNSAVLEANRLNEKFGGKVFNSETLSYE